MTPPVAGCQPAEKRSGKAVVTSGGVKVPSGSPPAATAAGTSFLAAITKVCQAAPSGGSVDYSAMAAAQAACAETQQFRLSPSLSVKEFQVGGALLLCDTSAGAVRPLVPLAHRRRIFCTVHELAHPGTRATRRLISSRFVWPRLAADVAEWCRECLQCAKGKITSHISSPVQPIAVPQARFSHIHVDLVGPLPTSREGYTHIMAMIDRSTRWVEAVPLSSTTAEACAVAFIEAWVTRFGVPALLTSDRGPQFTGAVWATVCGKLGVQHQVTTAYHPQSNGMVERVHQQIKNALRSRECGPNWSAHLHWVLLGLRAAPKESSAISSAELVYGSPLVLPGQFHAKQTDLIMEDDVPQPAVRDPPPTRPLAPAQATAKIPESIQRASHVFVRRGASGTPLTPLYSGPYKVLRRGLKSVDIEVGGRTETVSVDRLKPHTAMRVAQVETPPRRGRPPGKPSGSSRPVS
jgi:hypothetical protein